VEKLIVCEWTGRDGTFVSSWRVRVIVRMTQLMLTGDLAVIGTETSSVV
jgi:hypothetical protein